MPPTQRIVDGAIGRLVSVLCKVRGADEFDRIPETGPLILLTNHINNLEILVLRKYLGSRRVIGLAKAEAWDHRILRWLLDLWEAIPIRRGENDITALRRSLSVLKEGRILGLAPEGTRSRDGRLQRGHTGAVTIALKSGAPLLPMAYWGGERFSDNMKKLRRTPFHIAVGTPLRILTEGARVTSEIRQQIIDEIMTEIAKLLPSAYRGIYADRVQVEPRFLAPAGV